MMFFNGIPMMLALILILSGTALASLASWTLSCKKKVYGSIEFSLFLFSVAIYCFGYALEINQDTIEGIYDSLKIQFLGIPFTAVLFLIFSIKLISGKKLKYYLYIILLIIPNITVFLVLTLEKHNLFYIYSTVQNDGIFPLLQYTAGPWYIINMISLLSSSAAAEVILFISFFKSRGLHKKQILFVFFAGLLPFLSAVINPVRVHNFDLQPFLLTITGFFLSIALFRYRMFELIPYAREIAVDTIKELLIVFDREGRVQDINLSARHSDMLENIIIGAALPEKCPLKRFADSVAGREESYPDNLEYQFDYSENNYLLKMSFIKNRKYDESGFVFIVSNVTKSVKTIKELEYHAIYNSLTGLFNRRHILNLAVREIEIAEKSKTNLAVILIDIDYFKKINDSFGHYAGDCVLKETAQILSRELRVSDLLGRIGGEEFLIICPGSDAGITFSVSERLRLAIEAYSFIVDDEIIKITASFGVYSKSGSGSENIDDLIKKADIALYIAKNKGRNRSEIFSV